MIKHINQNKLKIKHLLGVQGENYPTEEDFLYEVVSELQDIDFLDKEFTTKDIAKNVKARISKSGTLQDSLVIMSDKGYFQMTENPKRHIFKLIQHPWC
jgi:hypothetical protein